MMDIEDRSSHKYPYLQFSLSGIAGNGGSNKIDNILVFGYPDGYSSTFGELALALNVNNNVGLFNAQELDDLITVLLYIREKRNTVGET